MTPAALLYQSIAARLASDPAHLGLTTFLKLVPIVGTYVPGVGLVFSALTLGTGTLAGIASTAVAVSGLDPLSGQYKILCPPPAGGWTWNYDGATPAPPVTVYGFAVVDAATGLLLQGVTAPIVPPLVLNGPAIVICDEASFLLVLPPLQ